LGTIVCNRFPVAIGTVFFCMAQTRTVQNPPVSSALIQRQLRPFLLQSDGLQKAAAHFGRIVLETPVRGITTEQTVDSLVADSSVIVIGNLGKVSSKLVDDGDSIATECIFHVERALKGSVSSDITFRVLGGFIEFPNGTSAEIRTPETTFLKAGSRYLVMLIPDNQHPGDYSVTSPLESLFQIKTDGSVDASASHDDRPHHISRDIGSDHADAFIARIQSVAAKRRTAQ